MIIKFMDIIRDADYNIYGTTILYEENGEIKKKETVDFEETMNFLYEFLHQTRKEYEEIKKYGLVNENYIGDVENGHYHVIEKYGYKFPNLAFVEPVDTYKYKGKIKWNKSKNMDSNKDLNAKVPKKFNVNIKALLLSLLLMGSIVLATYKGVVYIRRRNNTVQTMNYDGKTDENFINSIFRKFKDDKANNISEEDFKKFINEINGLYEDNFNNEIGINVSKRIGVISDFGKLFEEDSKERKILNYFENGYDNIIVNYVKNDNKDENAMLSLCNEFHSYIIEGKKFKNTVFKQMRPEIQYLLLEMFEECAKECGYYDPKIITQHEEIYHNLVLSSIYYRKNFAIAYMRSIIGLPIEDESKTIK